MPKPAAGCGLCHSASCPAVASSITDLLCIILWFTEILFFEGIEGTRRGDAANATCAHNRTRNPRTGHGHAAGAA